MNRRTPVSSVRDIGKIANQHRVFRAFLAEDYDGIGQYVGITLSKNGTSIGLKGRVGSGDFNTGQTMPEGTPVSVMSYKGKLEILSMGAK